LACAVKQVLVQIGHGLSIGVAKYSVSGVVSRQGKIIGRAVPGLLHPSTNSRRSTLQRPKSGRRHDLTHAWSKACI
jgi:hypothetical protein